MLPGMEASRARSVQMFYMNKLLPFLGRDYYTHSPGGQTKVQRTFPDITQPGCARDET